jgi:LacI family transcriptional regulator
MTVLKDVARLAGVDASTVSRVLRGDERRPAKPETRARILQVARDMGYTPNGVARSLRTRRQEAIGVVVPDLGNPAFAEIFQGIQAAAVRIGWHVIVVDGRMPAGTGRGWDRLVFEGRIDGLLVLVASIRDPIVQRVARSGFPLVLVNRRSDGVAGSVVMRDERGAEIAIEHLVALGHRRIGHIAGLPTFDTGRRRLAGVRAALRARGLSLHAAWLAATDHTEAGGVRAAREILARAGCDLPTAVYVASFLSGVGALAVFKSAGLRVPEDLSIVVSDELSLAAHIAPPLTTVRMPLSRMGAVATEVLLRAIGGEAPGDLVLPDEPELVVRASTAPPRVRLV